MKAMTLFPCIGRALSANAGALVFALAIGTVVAACKDTSADAAVPAAPVAAAATGSAPGPTAQTAQTAPAAATAADADDDDFPAARPDDSYNKATLRPQYTACVDASNGVTPALQACGDEELRYQEDRLAEIVATKVASPDSKEKDDWMDAQAAWWADTNRYCTWDPRTEGQGQMLDAQSCRINRVANRVDQLNAATDHP
ncbi:hypothetical protein C1922_01365 [Stenotrophomonas sp. ZAC14D2_NAIMI4_7]|uniref:lysozyme inhibitor LprI family protein n=1 Tax=Stenotrophomonas sp. ZAC14D2_NAIMI4_7 TaxID=2072405 RepID=UPI000D53ED66|nr:lysozyme inhibitor LprI family protein [Stenotrophomonas sp. ZAC14D2_NAIMI4_7]AWH16074.1 hypothetical protein C1922_01365 [Stenotrophomonas sp. ZAC14D2_NAIMI4_7]